MSQEDGELSEGELQKLASEDALAQRVMIERKRLGLSQQDLAAKVEAILGGGFPQSAVSKIEKPRGRRAITVDEALALSSVLGIPLLELTLPIQAAVSRTLARLFVEVIDATRVLKEAADSLEAVRKRAADELSSPEVFEELRRQMAGTERSARLEEFLGLINRDEPLFPTTQTGQVDG